MLTKVRRVGTSLGVLLPREACESAGLREGDRLFVGVQEGGDVVLAREPQDPGFQEFVDLLRPRFGKEVLKAYIFGSYAMGRFRPGRSDIDIYILARKDCAKGLQEWALRAAFDIERKGGRNTLSPVVVDEREFEEGWFDYEVLPGIRLYDAALPDAPLESQILARPGA